MAASAVSPEAPSRVRRVPDLRLTGLGAAAWAGALGGHLLARGSYGALQPATVAVGLLVVGLLVAGLVVVGVVGGGLAQRAPAAMAWALVAVVLGGVTLLRVEAVADGAVAGLAERRAVATVRASVVSDPVVRSGPFSDVLVYRVSVSRVSDPVELETRAPVVVLAEPGSQPPAWGSTVELRGRLAPADDVDTAALLAPYSSPRVLEPPSAPHRWAGSVRRSVRESAGGPAPGDRLVPALVDGDDAALPEEVVTDFRTAGLTHLTAVSGANLTILLAFLLPVARWGGVRAHGLLVVGALGIAGFVLLARPEPSVLRAAAMGTAALVGLTWGGRSAGARSLGAAVLGLLLLDPGLAVTWGFALSVAATAGILFLAPPVRDALCGYLPRWAAEAVAVPLAAQLACTPLVAALSGQVSVVAVAANLLAAPLVGPTTVLGLAAGLLGLVTDTLAAVPGWVAGVCAQGIVLTARAAATAPGAAVPWSPSGWPLLALVLLCLVLAWATPRLVRSPRVALVVATVLALALLRPPLPPGLRDLLPGSWPPEGWLMVMCDVGQGDAIVLDAGGGSAVVVDAGPDPRLVDDCLTRLGVRELPLVVLTHFHDDHVAGLPGVLRGRRVGEVLTSPLRSPSYGAASVDEALREAGVPQRVPAPGERLSLGALRWQVLGPPGAAAEDPNDASLVIAADVNGTRVLLTGDVQQAAQSALERAWSVSDVDLLKVPHHGSRYQDAGFLESLGAEVALVSAGEDNDYGHPAPDTLAMLRATGAGVWRTDTSGDLAVVRRGGAVVVVPRG